MMKKPKYIAVDGPICVGKTTLVKMLAEKSGGKVVLGNFDPNPVLTTFYKDRHSNAFKTQVYFLINRYQQQMGLASKIGRGLVFCDYTFAKDPIFAKINLSGEEAKLYAQLFESLSPSIPKPDLVVYLRADAKLLQSRIKKRAVDYEKGITEAYLKKLTHACDEYFLKYNQTPLLVVDVSNTDYINRPEDFEKLKKEIMGHRGGTVHFISR